MWLFTENSTTVNFHTDLMTLYTEVLAEVKVKIRWHVYDDRNFGYGSAEDSCLYSVPKSLLRDGDRWRVVLLGWMNGGDTFDGGHERVWGRLCERIFGGGMGWLPGIRLRLGGRR